jgi:tetratricopeptide (TPR) repeat protein
VEAAFKVSYDLLTESLQQRWTALAVFPASFDLSAVASVWLADEESTRQDLQALFNASLVEWNETSGRFRLHDLAKQFSLSHLDPATWERRMLLHAQHFMEVGARTDDLYLEGDENVLRGLALFDRERTHIEVIFERLKTRIDRESSIRLATLVNAVVYISALRHTPRERIVWLEAQRTAYRRLGDRRGEGNALGNLGLAHVNLGNTRKAIEFYEEALAIHREIGDRRGESNSLGNLGVAYSALGYSRKAIEFYEEALAIDRAIGDRRGEGNDLGNLANSHANLGDTSKAIEFYKQALVIDHEIGDRRGEGNDLGNLGNVYFELGDSHKAIDFFEQALVIDREIGDRGGESKTLGNLGSAYAKLGDMIKAFGFFEQHMAIAREFGDRRGEASAPAISAPPTNT